MGKLSKILKVLLISILITIIGLTIYYYFPEPKLPADTEIDSIIVYKSKRILLAFSKGQLVKKYKISLGRNPIGDKEFEGDMKTPEGIYYINDKNPNSGYHKNLGISYPNKEDLADAKKLGKPAGGQIKIHGLKNGQCYIGKFHRWEDWTYGCIALTDDEVDELFYAVKIGTKIKVKM